MRMQKKNKKYLLIQIFFSTHIPPISWHTAAVVFFWKLKKVNYFVKNYTLLPSDALIAASCNGNGIAKIATFDKDFEKVNFLEIIKP